MNRRTIQKRAKCKVRRVTKTLKQPLRDRRMRREAELHDQIVETMIAREQTLTNLQTALALATKPIAFPPFVVDSNGVVTR
jgi:hypothetical protein